MSAMLRPYLVWHTLGPGRSKARFHARIAPELPLQRGEAERFAATTAGTYPAYRGHAYTVAYRAADAIDMYRKLYAEFIP